MFFFRNSVRSAVVKVIDARIKHAQKRYEFSLKELFAETKAKIEAIRTESKKKEQTLLDECVKSVISL
jgi:hypothetical protein